MGNIAISVENLGKRYRIGLAEKCPESFREAITSFVGAPFKYLHTRLREANPNEILWALKDVSFEVKHGEVLGIIGRNGAGKSTLLKILSRITEPTEGQAQVYGRVGSLLEVGTGFHPELTGRENIYLNGAILGMRRMEIDRKLDEIVDFSGIEKFLDTPVKRYSSGMRVRLGFAVAAHLEPEILVVDEVLAVGDAEFQKKCLGKMGDVAKEGRTILFVSHNMIAIQNLCSRGIWLECGKTVKVGQIEQVVSNYLQTTASSQTEQVWDDPATAPGNEFVRLHRICVRPENGAALEQITMQTPLVTEIEYWHLIPGMFLSVTFHIFNEQGIIAFASGTGGINEKIWQDHSMPAGLYCTVCHIPGNLLNNTMYGMNILIIKDRNGVIYQLENAVLFNIVEIKKERGAWYGKSPGVVHPLLEWTTELVKTESEDVVI